MANKSNDEFSDTSAEAFLIGNLLLEPSITPLVASRLAPKSLVSHEAKAVYKGIVDTVVDGQGVLDFLALEKTLKGNETLLEYLETLQADTMPADTETVLGYVARINNLYYLRSLSSILDDLQVDLNPDLDYTQAIGHALLRIQELGTIHEVVSSSANIAEAAEEARLAIQKWRDKEAGHEGVPTGMVVLDRLIARLPAGEVTVVAGRPGMGKCLGKGTKVVMYDGSLKAVEDVVPGEQLMGPDSMPRNVLSVARGREMMYWVRQKHGIDYRVNKSHILSLKRSKTEGKWQQGDVHNVSVREIEDKGPGFFSRFKGYKAGIELPEREVPLEPYFLGLWLGDGKTTGARIYTTDREVISYLEAYATRRQESLSERDMDRPCHSFLITGGKSQPSRDGSVQSTLGRMGLLGNKHIPESYLLNSKAKRLELLAGLIDSDGHYPSGLNGPYEITMVDEHLVRQIKFLCDSLGYRTSLTPKIATIKDTGCTCEVFRVRFNGDVDEIPVRVARKKARAWNSNIDWRVTGISIEQDEVDDYYGVVIDGDHLFLLEDMTVTHNTAFATQIAFNVARMSKSGEIAPGLVAFFSAEMSGRDLALRVAGAEAGVASNNIRSGDLSDADQRALNEALDEMAELPIHIDPTPSPTNEEMFFKLSVLKAYQNVSLVIFDYLELGGESGASEELRISAIARGLRVIAKQLNVPVMALSQLSREVEKRKDKVPQLSDLRYSGMIEQVAYLAILLYRSGYYEERGQAVPGSEDQHNVCDVIIAKNRNGPVGVTKMYFDPAKVKFFDLEYTHHSLRDE